MRVTTSMKNKKNYIPQWEEVSATFKTSVAIELRSFDSQGMPLWICENCGVTHNTQRVNEKTGAVYLVKIASAHLNHDPWNVKPELASWCQSCHMRYDCSKKQKERKRRIEELHFKAVQQVKAIIAKDSAA
jgi:protein-arginine kinase activator protein McsA